MSEASRGSTPTDENASLRAARTILGVEELTQVQRTMIRDDARLATLVFAAHAKALVCADEEDDEAFVASDQEGGIHVLAVEDSRPVVKRFDGPEDDDPDVVDLLARDQDFPTWLAYADQKWGLDRVLVSGNVF